MLFQSSVKTINRMGQSGYYDDEGDPVEGDFAHMIEKRVLPKHILELPLYKNVPCSPKRKGCTSMIITKEHEKNAEIRRKYMVGHSTKIWQEVKKIAKKDEYYAQDFVIAGIALYLARGWRSTRRLPGKLPEKFPPGMKRAALRASNRELKNFDNHEKWVNIKERKKALRKQILLFSS